MPITPTNPFQGKQYSGEVIILCVRPYLLYPLSCAHVAEGQDRYLWRAVDSTGQTIYFLLTAKRDAEAAKRFFPKALQAEANPQPRVINVDRNATYPTAIEQLKAEGTLRQRCRLRQCKFLTSRGARPQIREKEGMAGQGLRFLSQCVMNRTGDSSDDMIRKGRVRLVAKDAV